MSCLDTCLNFDSICAAPGSIFAYGEGTTYIYSVEGTTITSLTGTKGDGSKLSLKATAELSVQPNCAQFLKLSGVSITDSDGKVRDDTSFVFGCWYVMVYLHRTTAVNCRLRCVSLNEIFEGTHPRTRLKVSLLQRVNAATCKFR